MSRNSRNKDGIGARSTSNVIPNLPRNPVYIDKHDNDDDDDIDDDGGGQVFRVLMKAAGGASTSGSSNITDTTVPNFLLKLWKLVEDPNYDFCIGWDSSGSSFHVREPYAFSKDVLPLFFKHSNLNSFIRQLNMYGFRKVTSLEQGALKHPTNEMDSYEFHHQYFIRGHPELLQYIKRKGANVKMGGGQLIEEGGGSSRGLNHALAEVRQLREKQATMDAKLNQIKKENETLWSEIGSMRQLHMKQQQVVGKLIQFLMTVVQPAGGGRFGKRNLLAIGSNIFNPQVGDVSNPPAKRMRIDSTDAVEIIESLEQELRNRPKQTAVSPSGYLSNVDVGPTIADVTEEANPDMGVNILNSPDIIYTSPPEPISMQNIIGNTGMIAQESNTPATLNEIDPLANLIPAPVGDLMQRPQQQSTLVDQQQQNPSQNWLDNPTAYQGNDNQVAGQDNLSWMSPLGKSQDNYETQQSWSKPEFSQYLDYVQNDLESLKDFLTSEGLEVEHDALQDLFTDAEENMTSSLTPTTASTTNQTGGIVGNEVQVYKEPQLLLDFDFGSSYGNPPLVSSSTTTPSLPSMATNVSTAASFDPIDLQLFDQSSTTFATPTKPEQNQRASNLFDQTNNNFYSANTTANTISQSPLTTPIMSPVLNSRSITDQQRPVGGNNVQRANLTNASSRGVRSAADEMLHTAFLKSKTGKKR